MIYYQEPYGHRKNKIKVELDLSNYATKSNLKGERGTDTSKHPKKVDLASLKSDVDNLDIDELETIP